MITHFIYTLRFIFMLALTVLAMPSAAKKITIIHSYHLDFPWVAQYRSGFFSVVPNAEIIEYEMDTKRQPKKNLPLLQITPGILFNNISLMWWC